MTVEIDGQRYEYVTNYATRGLTITDKTVHKVRERDGLTAVAQCGSRFHAEDSAYHDGEERSIQDRDKCGHCFPERNNS